MNIKHFFSFFLIITLSLSFISSSQAQFGKKRENKDDKKEVNTWIVDTLIQPIPINRQIFTDRVAQELVRTDARDGRVDEKISVEDEQVSQMLTDAILKKIPQIDILIENMPSASHQEKIGYHRALQNLIRRFNQKSFESGDLNYFRRSVQNFRGLLIAIEDGKIKEFARNNANIYTLDNSELLDAFPSEKAYVYETVGTQNPEMMITRLPEFGKESYADPIVAAAAKVVPNIILTYATSTSALSGVVRRNKDPLVQTIVRIGTESRNSNRALPFLYDIHNKKRTIQEIDAISGDESEYFKALVSLKTQENTVENRTIDNEINYRGLGFVRVVNELHERPASVRFKSLLEFNAEELYFMMIGGQDEIYTSSFTWMFDRMMEQMKPETSDDFLKRINNSQFRTWIRMCANFGRLSPFMQAMPEDERANLMREFVAGLEKGGPDDLEDAVNVADAFGGLKDEKILDFLKKEVQENYERTYRLNNEESQKGVIIYGLLSTIFNSSENSDNLSGDLSSLIPPITYVPNSSLKDENGTVNQQVFFYGDDDGKGAYANFVPLFRNSRWKIEDNKYWITITSTGKNKVVIYANKPLTEPEDEVAQRKLKEYFDKNSIEPSVVIHRGHSYFVPTTISYLTPAAKVIVLGSCGGYHNLGAVLDRSPDAHIISSKQVGALSINVPITTALKDDLVAGRDIDWLKMWSNLDSYFSKRGRAQIDLFNDYIPPNKNLGAIFIKAYRKLEQQGEQ